MSNEQTTIEQLMITAGGGSAGLMLLVWVARKAFSAWIRDNLSDTKTEATADLIETLRKERDDAVDANKKCWDQYNEMQREVGKLQALNDSLRKREADLEALVAKLNDKIDSMDKAHADALRRMGERIDRATDLYHQTMVENATLTAMLKTCSCGAKPVPVI